MRKPFYAVFAFAIVIGAIIAYRLFAPFNSQMAEEKILSIFKDEEPSPYSLKWDSPLARVVDQEGNPVAAATVTFTKYLKKDCEGNVTEEPPEWQDITVTTNQDGEFPFPPEIWQLEDEQEKPSIHAKIEAEGFLKRDGIGIGANYADDNGEIDLFRIGRIEGAIIDPNGQPLANVPLWFNTHTYYKNPSESCGGCFSANVKTDDAGSFIIEKVPPGQHILKFPGHSGGCGPEPKVEKIPFEEYATFQQIVIKDGQIKTNIFLDLRESRGTIRGKVVDQHNRPIAGANAVLLREIKRYFEDGSGWSSSTENLKSTLADENGNYVLTHVPSGDYRLQAQYPYEKGKNYKPGNPLNIYLAGKQQVTFNLVLQRQDDSLPKPARRDDSLFELSLPKDLDPREMMIVDPQGNGIPNASVTFESTITIEDQKTHQKTTKAWNGAALTTDHRGIFTLPDEIKKVEGKWLQCQATIKADNFEERSIWLRAYYLDRERRFDILPLSRISGQLIGLDGKPAKGRVEMRSSMRSYRNPNSELNYSGYNNQPTNEDGKFVLEKIPEGTHIIHYTIEANGMNEARTGAVIVYTQGGQDVQELIIDPRKNTCAVQGRVLDLEGKPVTKAYVRLLKTIQWGYRGYTKTWPEFYHSEKTNRKGVYSLENVAPGVYELEAVLEGDTRRTSDKMSIALGDGQHIELDIRLRR